MTELANWVTELTNAVTELTGSVAAFASSVTAFANAVTELASLVAASGNPVTAHPCAVPELPPAMTERANVHPFPNRLPPGTKINTIPISPLSPLRGYGGPLHPAPKGRSRKAWGVSPR